MEHLVKNITIIDKVKDDYVIKDRDKGIEKTKILNEWLFMNLISNGDVFKYSYFNDIRFIDNCLEQQINPRTFQLSDIKKIISDNNDIDVNVDIIIDKTSISVKNVINISISDIKHLIPEDDENDKIKKDILFQRLFQKQVETIFNSVIYMKMSKKLYETMYEMYKDELIECFATPFTSILLKLGGSYCSISESIEFGSLGNFFNIDLSNKYLIADFPSIVDLLYKVSKRLVEIKDNVKGFLFFVPDDGKHEVTSKYMEINDISVIKLQPRKYYLEFNFEKVYPNYGMLVYHHNMKMP